MALEPTKTYFTGFVPRIQDSLVLEPGGTNPGRIPGTDTTLSVKYQATYSIRVQL